MEEPPPRRFSISTFITAAQKLRSTENYTDKENLAAVRAIYRSGAVRDSRHLVERTVNGLHPSYFLFRSTPGSSSFSPTFHDDSTVQEGLAKLNEDLYDSATMLDRVDGGITLVMRVPGFAASGHTDTPDITVDSYITPIARQAGGENLERTAVYLMQKFGEELVLPHLHQYNARCDVEGISAQSPPNPGPQIRLERPHHLPDSAVGSAFLRCRLRDHGRLAQMIVMDNLPSYGLGPLAGDPGMYILIAQSTLIGSDTGPPPTAATPVAHNLQQPEDRTWSPLSVSSDLRLSGLRAFSGTSTGPDGGTPFVTHRNKKTGKGKKTGESKKTGKRVADADVSDENVSTLVDKQDGTAVPVKRKTLQTYTPWLLVAFLMGIIASAISLSLY
ncbi:hypothetical protein BDN72DRAFT_902508 [Pluteus cervinus]|uniref:Uncharacterized protein n=1 Tax=Pluteus cervinus TaxID=181527 RepID=A0ACD3ACB9_9AGAR|nr:hypothetical protein BDN72DRAFT_902508 [Pluteus cervinus]